MYPTHFGTYLHQPPERGDPRDETYFFRRNIRHGDVVYIAALDLPLFISLLWEKIPETISFTLGM